MTGFGDRVRRAAAEQEATRRREAEGARQAEARHRAEVEAARRIERVAMIIAEDLEARSVPYEHRIVEIVEYKVRLFSSRTDYRHETVGEGWGLRISVGEADPDRRVGPPVQGAILTNEGQVLGFSTVLSEQFRGVKNAPYEIVVRDGFGSGVRVLEPEHEYDDEEMLYYSLLQLPTIEADLADLAARCSVDPALFD